jgi:hypothetical protein
VSHFDSPERDARPGRASAGLTMDPVRTFLVQVLGLSWTAHRPGPAVTTFRSRALGAFLFMAGLAAILAVTLVRS